MREYLLDRLKEVREEIERVTVDKINLGISLAMYKKLNDSRKEHSYNSTQAKKSAKMILKTTLEFFGLLIWFSVLDVEIGLLLKACLGGLVCIGAVGVAFLISEIKALCKHGNYLRENGYDPYEEADMQKLSSKQSELENEYKETNNYLDELVEVEEDLQSMMDSNDLSNGMEKYPELLEDILNIEFEEYMEESVKPEKVDFEPIVIEEELIWNSPHQLKLK